jgi:hypothetical protein
MSTTEAAISNGGKIIVKQRLFDFVVSIDEILTSLLCDRESISIAYLCLAFHTLQARAGPS